MARESETAVRRILSAVLSVLFALLIGGLIIEATGESALHTYRVLFMGALAGRNALAESLLKMSTLLLTGLSYAFVVQCGLINIGAEGQLYMGAALSAFVGIRFSFLPGPLLMACAVLAGFAGGAFWGGLVGLLKVRFHANEIITSLMLNYIAIQLISYLVGGPMKDTTQAYPYSPAIQEAAKLPVILGGTRLHAGICIALLCLLFYWFFFKYTAPGYRMRVIGHNERSADYAGFNVKRHILFATVMGGGFAGLGGALEILGVQHRLFENFSIGYGFDGIAASLLAGNSPLGMLFTSFLFGALKNGGNSIQMFTGVPSALATIVQAVVIIAVLMKLFGRIFDRVKPGKGA